MKIKDIFYYAQGTIRYELFYSRFKFLIPKHISEQITYRINSMDMECYWEGQCKRCGCKTTALQMCNKPCDKPCYPEMLNKKIWNALTKDEPVGTWERLTKLEIILQNWALDTKNLKFVKRWNGKNHI